MTVIKKILDGMKYTSIILSTVICAVCINSCTLDPEIELDLTEDDVFHTYNNSLARLNACYLYLPDGLSYIGGAMLACACDEAEYVNLGSAVQKFNTGSWNAISNPDDAWSRCWTGIYTCNNFLANSDEIDLEHLRLDPDPTVQAQYQTFLKNIKRWHYEARFLRAYYYYEIIMRYGGVPIITLPLGPQEDFTKYDRSSLQACIDFIVEECEAVAEELPAVYEDADMGRATRGAAMALKAKVLVLAASELFNNVTWFGSYAHPELVTVEGDRLQKYIDAAKALKVVMDMSSRYTIADNYSQIFRDFQNGEHIFSRRYSQSNSFERNNYSVGFDGGNSGTTPSQNLVDAYEMTDGTAFDWNAAGASEKPYENRDPRLSASIVLNGTTFKGRLMEIFTGGRDGIGVYNATRTGYYIKKFIDPNLDLLQNRMSYHVWPIFRISDIYLNYAEMMNSAYGPSQMGETGMTALQAVNAVRKRRSMPVIPSTVSQAELTEKIRHERQVELAFEGHRFFDLRRWMTAEQTLGADLRGVRITRNGYDYIYEPYVLESRSFEPKMYFYPIPQTDVNVSGWPQNPLW